jgi:predicted adenylyl cyclase CyaB
MSRRFGLVLKSAMLRALAAIRHAYNNSNKRHLEVERKFKLTDAEARKMPVLLSALGFLHREQVYMTDTFLPVIVESDMMRIRDETADHSTRCLLTRKSWVEVEGERERQETEEKLDMVARGCLLELGERMNGGKLLSFTKQRDHYHCPEGDFKNVVVCVDSVDGLGEYSGSYVEIELLVEEGGDVQSARTRISQIAATLLGQERECVQLSYQDMLKRVAL